MSPGCLEGACAGIQHRFYEIVYLVIDLQTELNFAWEIAMAGHVPEATNAPADLGPLDDRAILVPTLIDAKNRSVADVQEVCPKLDIHPFRNVRAFDDGDILAVERGAASFAVGARGVTKSILGGLLPGIEIEHAARRSHSVRIPGPIDVGLRSLVHAGNNIGTRREAVRPEVRVQPETRGNHLRGATRVLLDSCNHPASHHSVDSTPNVCEFLARPEGQFVLIGNDQVLWKVKEAQ